MRRGGPWSTAALALGLALAGCGRLDAPPPPGGMRLRFEDRPAPEAFALEAVAVRDRPDGSPGLWAAVRGLPRPERALVVNRATGEEVVVALFRSGSGPAIRLSNEAADALGLRDPETVRITALRQQTRIDTTRGRF
jgi:hypothetical protein